MHVHFAVFATEAVRKYKRIADCFTFTMYDHFPPSLFSPAQQRLNALSFITYYLVMLHIIVFFLIAANLDFKRLLYDVNSFFFRRLTNEEKNAGDKN